MIDFVDTLTKNMDSEVLGAFSACIIGIVGIFICQMVGKVLERKTKENVNKTIPFSERHPKLNIIMALCIIVIIASLGYIAGYYLLYCLGVIFARLLAWLKNELFKLDAVVIVAFITGGVSIFGVIINSIVAKILEFRRTRQEYLAKKREMPYGEFVEMVYKIQQNVKKPGTYTEQMMLEDLSKFSRQITLWGSPKVVNKWVAFRENGAKPNAGTENLFVMEEIMNEMRKDLGLKKVKKGNLLAFFVNDIKEVMRKK